MAPSFFRRRSVATAGAAERPPQQGIPEPTVEEEQSQDKAEPSWPPRMSQASLHHLINAATDWQLLHGSIVKQPVLRAFVSQRLAVSTPTTVSLMPTPFPRRLFEDASNMQNMWNELYAKVSCDRAWLKEVTRELRKVDAFARVLWEIAEESEKRRLEISSRIEIPNQSDVLEMAFWRSDYMIHEYNIPFSLGGKHVCVKQTEFSTLGCAGGVRSNQISDMHQYLASTGLYRQLVDPNTGYGELPRVEPERLPINDTMSSIVQVLSSAYQMYNDNCRALLTRNGVANGTAGPTSQRTCVLMVVQPFSSSVADERPVEYGLWHLKPPVPCFRVSFGQETQERTRLLSDGRLLFDPPGPLKESFEVAVVFYCAGHEEQEYLDVDSFDWAAGQPRQASTQTGLSVRSRGAQCRIQLEASNAIMCPPSLSQIATSKFVQAALTDQVMLKRFLPGEPTKQQKIQDTRVKMLAASGEEAGSILADPSHAKDFILSPALQGAGTCASGVDVINAAQKMSGEKLAKQVLCYKPGPPPMQGLSMSSRGLYSGPTTQELQIFGSSFWRRDRSGGIQLEHSNSCGWALNTRSVDSKEKGDARSHHAYDSPLLVSDEEFNMLYASKQPAASPTDHQTPRSFSTAF